MKTPSSRPILIYFEFRSKLAFTHYCHRMNPHSPKKIHCDKILFSHTQRGYQFLFLDYFIIFLFFFCYFTFSLIFTKIILLLLFYRIFFFMKIIFIFSCSGMFHVPVFIDAQILTGYYSKVTYLHHRRNASDCMHSQIPLVTYPSGILFQ